MCGEKWDGLVRDVCGEMKNDELTFLGRHGEAVLNSKTVSWYFDICKYVFRQIT